MNIAFPALIVFVVSMTFSPGPNNIMCASIGMRYGYRKALPFVTGVFCGFTVVLLLGALVATTLLAAIPVVEPILKYVGAAYVLWLAWVTWSHRSDFGVADDAPLTRSQGFVGAFVLQFANPKGVAYSLLMYSTFLASLVGSVPLVLLSAVLLAGVAFLSTSTWALAGAAIRKGLRTDTHRAVAAGVLALALVYTAVELAELPSLIFG